MGACARAPRALLPARVASLRKHRIFFRGLMQPDWELEWPWLKGCVGILSSAYRRGSLPCQETILTIPSTATKNSFNATAGAPTDSHNSAAALLASEDLLKQHYIDLKDRPFFPGLVKYMNSGPIVAMVWEGLNVVKTGRVMLGETNPADSKPGTIRGDFCIQVGRNIIHGSDSVESAQKEINLWFKPTELIDFKPCAHDWIYE